MISENNTTERGEIKKINTWLSFYYTQFDTSPPAVIEGRVHPIQFSNSITRINAAGRSFREKKLFLGIVLWMALAILITYPFLDTDYYLPIVLIFGPILLLDYIYYSILQTKTASLLLSIVEQENELFVNNGMRLKFYPYTNTLEMEVMSPLSDSSQLHDEYLPSFRSLHETYGTQSAGDESVPSSRRSSSSSVLVDIEPLSGYESTPTLLRHAMNTQQPSSPSTRLLDAAFIAKSLVPSVAPAHLIDIPVSTSSSFPRSGRAATSSTEQPGYSTSQPMNINPLMRTDTTTSSSIQQQAPYIDPDMPEGITLSPPPAPSAPLLPTKYVHTAPVARRSALASSDSSIPTKKGRRVSISNNILVLNERVRELGRGGLPVIYEEGGGGDM